jgi:CIC family chloride channel protein
VSGGEPRPQWWALPARSARALREALALLWLQSTPLDLRLVGRTLWHAALVGAAAGLLGAAFFAALELVQRLLLFGLAGYEPLRAHGEAVLAPAAGVPLRPWLVALLPALGGLAAGWLVRRTPEAAGGGGDATIEAYHARGGLLPARLVPLKMAASICTLGSGGAGGREGPTMLIGGAVGSVVGRVAGATAQERRILVLAGVAAGISAVFRTPLGAALLAVEFVYRDDFEAEGLVPAILASVVAYAIVIALFGESTLLGVPARMPFVAAHLPLYALLAVAVAAAAAAFLALLRAVQRAAARLRALAWLRPALGGLATGLVGAATLLLLARQVAPEAARLGVLGGGYGLAQATLTGAPGLPAGWALVAVLLALAAAKAAAAALTIGSGGSAGDFAPSLVIGALVGAAFGNAAALVTGDPRIQPAAFALVGMGTFYGGLAHVPLAALVLVAELAGSYDLLVPMMAAIAVATVALRRVTLYRAQPPTRRDSPLHRADLDELAALDGVRVAEVSSPPELEGVPGATPLPELLRLAAALARQEIVPVLGADGAPRGLVDAETLRAAAGAPELAWAVAADLAGPLRSVAPGDTLRAVAAALGGAGGRQIPVIEAGRVVGIVGVDEVARVLLARVAAADADERTDRA